MAADLLPLIVFLWRDVLLLGITHGRPIAYPPRSSDRGSKRQAHLDGVVQVERGQRIARQPEKVVIVVRISRLVVVSSRALVRRDILPWSEVMVRHDQLSRQCMLNGVIRLML
jgi:hypothetical protein